MIPCSSFCNNLVRYKNLLCKDCKKWASEVDKQFMTMSDKDSLLEAVGDGCSHTKLKRSFE